MPRWAATIGAALVAAAAFYEYRGRRLRRRDSTIPVPCGEDSQIRLTDGRLLGYRETGPRDGDPALYFHGALGSRLEWPASPRAVFDAGVRLIAIDRAGYGCSDALPFHTLAQSVDDVRQLVDALGLARFRIIAWSAGTVYAMACAVRMPERITRLDLVGAVVPEEYPDGGDERDQRLVFFAALARWAPGASYALMRRPIERREADPEWFECELEKRLSAPDRAVLARPEIRDMQKRNHAAGQSRLAVGIMGDLEAGGRKWDFAPQQVKVPVVMWQGSEDSLTPASRNRRLLGELPDVELRSFPGEGHFLLFRHERELLCAGREGTV